MTLSTEMGHNSAMEIFSDNISIPPMPEASIHQHSHHRRHRGRKERMTAGLLREMPHITVFHTQNEGPGLEGLSPVRLEIEPGEKRRVMSARKRTFKGFDSLIPEQMNISPGAGTPVKAMRHPTGRNVFGGHIIRAVHDEESLASGKKRRVSFDQRFNINSFGSPTESVFPAATAGSLIPITAAVGGKPSTKPTPSSKPQVRSSGGDVTPTFNITFFDWADYEYMRPADKKQFSKKQGSDKHATKSPSTELVTLTSEESCKHHLDCLPGSCCNLRKHVCELHNRGFNNKCYDSCMCEEGLAVIIIPLLVKFGSHIDWIFDYLTDVNGKIAIAAYITVINGFLLIIYKGPLYKVAVRACFLGFAFGCGLILSLADTAWTHFGWYMCSLSFFHYSEYLVTAIINPRSLSLDSFLLNHSIEYTLAAISSWIEFTVEMLLIPEIKQVNWLCLVGLVMVLCGDSLRKAAMLTAGSNFNHIVQNEKAQSHVLVTTGVYALFRHPSYVGWFYWSTGTQIMLCNPICILGYTIASWRFFRERIEEEEISLIHFFGEDYVEYKKKVFTGLPFISGIRVNS
ncbi:unnamed protein product [Leuciscus chuanchicus]